MSNAIVGNESSPAGHAKLRSRCFAAMLRQCGIQLQATGKPIRLYWGGIESTINHEPDMPYIDGVYHALSSRSLAPPWPWDGINVHIHRNWTTAELVPHVDAIETERAAVFDSVVTCERVGIANNIIRDTRQVAIEFWGSKAPNVTSVRYAAIAGNVIEQSLVIEGADQFGISLNHAEDVTVQGNVVSSCVYGLEAAGSRFVGFYDNIVQGCTVGAGITSETDLAATDIEVIGNIVNNPHSHGIFVDGVTNVSGSNYPQRLTFIGDQVRAGLAKGIYLNYGVPTDVLWVCQSNTVTGCAQSGLYCNKTNKGVVGGNISDGNNTGGSPNEDQFSYAGGTVGTVERCGNIGTWTVV